eukprot:CAMPEP_0178379846 /NCGR_PEP_ID=MMETSP0689_2-20121128/5156_1 /TAXON_ID=160604 /ORGANISM="Amphidinium massartii, Strain CS-259" /LENGTH=167 /DNA_ID=CAMNT_0019999967 /DNA_START=25 /DNA_END=525 /DNA_ORIENTATION=+
MLTAADDRDKVLVAVADNGLQLEFATEALKSDKEVVFLAVSQNGLALQHAAEHLRSDKEVVMAAVANNSKAMTYASPSLLSDDEVLLIVLRQRPMEFLNLPEEADVIFMKKVMAELPSSTMARLLVLGVTALSGRSACFLLDPSQHADLMQKVLDVCAEKFDLPDAR